MFPESLCSLKRFCNWVKKEPHGKIPLQHCDKPETWLSYEAALANCSQEPFVGLGIQLGPPIIGIDLDWKDNPAMEPFVSIPEYAQSIIDTQKSYTEWSPSGLGVHILCSGRLDSAIKTSGIEVYGEGRFFTITGKTILDLPIAAYRPIAARVPKGMKNNDLASEAGRILARREATSAEELRDRLQTYVQYHHAGGDPNDPKLLSIAQRFWDKYSQDGNLSELVMTDIDGIEDEQMEWLWDHKVPLGHVTCFVGAPGIGKSSMAQHLAATISRDGHRTIILNAEEHLASATKPRLRMMGADLLKITIAQVSTGSSRPQEIRLDTQIRFIHEALATKPDTRLLIIDPINSYLGDKQMNKETDVRDVLAGLVAVAETYNIAVVIITHFNKSISTDAKDRTMGARAFTGVPRIVWTFQKDPDDSEQRLMAPGKSEHLEGLRYTITKATDEKSGNEVGIIVLGGATQHTADEVLEEHSESTSKRTKKEIVEYVLELLEAAGQPVDAGRVQMDASERFKVSVSTVKRAMEGKVRASRVGGGKSLKYTWELMGCLPSSNNSF